MKVPSLKSIILVDDDEISNLFNKIFIGKLNLDVKVDIFLNGQEALEYLDYLAGAENTSSIEQPCLLLLDIKMPKMDGWKFMTLYLEKIDAALRENIVVVMLTTSEDEGDMIKAMQNPHIQEFMQKPLSEKKFRHLIKKFFTKKELK